MTTPRGEIVDNENSGFYHCISRCVRRAFLCGYDPYSRTCYEHRKTWVRSRLKLLCEIFAIDCITFAIMANHLHTLLRTRPEATLAWSAEEVARRWCAVFPVKKELLESRISEIASCPELVELYRQRLCDLSWFNRCLNENIARRANREDNCTGRFWQGRFKSQFLHDSAAVLACSVYIDLNPVRAGAANSPESSDYTSVQVRARQLQNQHDHLVALSPKLIAQCDVSGVSEETYLEIVEDTGRTLASGKHRIDPSLDPILERLGLRPSGWLTNARHQNSIFKRIVASTTSLRKMAERKGKLWFQGLSAARIVFA